MTGIRPQTWTPTILSEVEHLWTIEGKTALAIATQFGMTRSMIAGIVSRNGWKRPEAMNVSNRSNGNAKGHVSRKAPAKPPKKPPEPVEAAQAMEVPGTPLEALRPYAGCRWPTSEKPWLFCNRPGFPWCCKHRKLAYTVSKVRAA